VAVLLLFALILIVLEYLLTKKKGMWGLSLIVIFIITFMFLIPADASIIVGMSSVLLITFNVTYYINWRSEKSS
jgi:membrane-bound ClpP family serine protease